jgi:hypothetical protein
MKLRTDKISPHFRYSTSSQINIYAYQENTSGFYGMPN